MSRTEYIEKHKDEAIYQMSKYKIPASITLAQGILESSDGNSELAMKSNNHFGIKCHSDWEGEKVYHDDDKSNECFRKYSKVRDSYDDHSEFLQKTRYASLFTLSIKDYKAWAKGLKKAGYATNPKYAKHLIRIIEENNLNRFDEEIIDEKDKLFFSGFSVGWKDLISQSLVYVNKEKEVYFLARFSASISDFSFMIGGGKLLTDNIGVGADIGVLTNTGDIDLIDFKPNYGIASHFFIPINQKQINIRLSLSTLDAKQFVPSVSIGLLR
jgi:hypothetical protein